MMRPLTIRDATDDDYPAFVRLIAQLGTGDPAPSLEAWREGFARQTLIAQRDGVVEGYVYGPALSGIGYVRNLVTDLPARGRGVGRALMLAIAARFGAAGCTRWCLNVKPDNVAALALYTALGLRPTHAGASLRVPWRALDALAPGAQEARSITDEDIPALEAAWDLAPGLLAAARERGWHNLVVAPTLGVASFNPNFPGAFPFRARGLEVAAALARAMRPHALAEHDFVRIMVEDDDALRAALESRGAVATLETVHMRGPLSAVPLAPSGRP